MSDKKSQAPKPPSEKCDTDTKLNFITRSLHRIEDNLMNGKYPCSQEEEIKKNTKMRYSIVAICAFLLGTATIIGAVFKAF